MAAVAHFEALVFVAIFRKTASIFTNTGKMKSCEAVAGRRRAGKQ